MNMPPQENISEAMRMKPLTVDMQPLGNSETKMKLDSPEYPQCLWDQQLLGYQALPVE